VCTNDGIKPDAHLVYSDPAKPYISDSAKYIEQQFKTNGKAGPQPSPNVGVGDNTAALQELGQILGGPKVPSGACGLALENAKKGPIARRSMEKRPLSEGSLAEALLV
jgi:hypothetical protein